MSLVNKLVYLFSVSFLIACSDQQLYEDTTSTVKPVAPVTVTKVPQPTTNYFCKSYRSSVSKDADLSDAVGEKLEELATCQRQKNNCNITGDCSLLTTQCEKILSCIE